MWRNFGKEKKIECKCLKIIYERKKRGKLKVKNHTRQYENEKEEMKKTQMLAKRGGKRDKEVKNIR